MTADDYTIPRPSFDSNEYDLIFGCLLVAPGYPPPSPTSTRRPCTRCGRALWVSGHVGVFEPGERMAYLCLPCQADVIPPGTVPQVLPATRAYLERRFGPRDWDALARRILDYYRAGN